VERGFAPDEGAPVTQGTPDSDLGPWIVLLWMGRAVVGAVRSLAML
jgi:hypothetical protein